MLFSILILIIAVFGGARGDEERTEKPSAFAKELYELIRQNNDLDVSVNHVDILSFKSSVGSNAFYIPPLGNLSVHVKHALSVSAESR